MKFWLMVVGVLISVISMGVGIYRYLGEVLNVMSYVGIIIGIIFLFAGAYKSRKYTGATIKDAWEGLGWVRGNLNPLYTITTTFYAVVMIIGLFLLDNTNIKWWTITFTIVVCHFVASIKVIGPRENGVMILLGRIIGPSKGLRHIKSGARFAPWPIQIIRITKNEIVSHFGTAGDEETRKKAEMSSDSQSWYVDTEPIRINFGIPDATEAKEFLHDPLAERLTVDPHMYVTIEIFDPATYVEKVGHSVEEGLERIKATATRAMQEMAGRTFVAKAVKNIGEMNTQLLTEIEELVGDPDAPAGTAVRDSWGVNVVEAGIKSLGLPKTINIALRDLASIVPKAERISRATSITADGEEARLVKEGRGNASALLAKNEAEADGITKKGVATAAALAARGRALDESAGARTIIQTDAVIAGLQHGKAVFLPSGGISDLVSAVVTGAAAYDATKPKPTSPAPSTEERES